LSRSFAFLPSAQRGADPLGTLLGRALTGRLPAALARRRIGVQFLLQLPQLGFGLGQRFFQRRLATERSGPRAGANFHPILRHAVEGHQPFGHQAGHALRQQAVEQLDVLRAKVGERVIVHRHTAANPTIGRVLLAQPVQFPRAAHPPQGGVEPQGQEDARVGGGLPRTSLDRLDPLVQLRQVEAADVNPDGPRLMLLGKKFVERTFLKFDLIAHRVPQPFGPDPRRQRLGGLGFLPRPPVEQRPLIHCPSSDLPGRPGRTWH